VIDRIRNLWCATDRDQHSHLSSTAFRAWLNTVGTTWWMSIFDGCAALFLPSPSMCQSPRGRQWRTTSDGKPEVERYPVTRNSCERFSLVGPMANARVVVRYRFLSDVRHAVAGASS
jgi:hypothetical protein